MLRGRNKLLKNNTVAQKQQVAKKQHCCVAATH